MENALADEQDEWRKNYLKEVHVSRSLAKRVEALEEKLEEEIEKHSHHDDDAPETPECTKCLVLERELDVLRARHKSLIEKFKLLEEELAYARRSPLMNLLSPKRRNAKPKHTTEEVLKPQQDEVDVPTESSSSRKRLPTRIDLDQACQSVFRQNNNIPHVLQAASSTCETELFHHGILFGYADDPMLPLSPRRGKDDASLGAWVGKMLKSPPTSPSSRTPRRKPKVMSVFPATSSLADVEPMMEFCFPHGDASVAFFDPSDEKPAVDLSFVVLLSGTQPAQNMYAMCVIPAARPLWCFCLVSVHPFFSLFFKLLHGIVDMCAAHAPQAVQVIFDDVLRRLHATAVPPMGGWCCFRLHPQHPLLTFHRPHTATARAEERQFVLEYTLPLLVSKVSLDHLLVLLGCLCTETKVLLLSDDPALLTACVLALRALLAPLAWAGVVITLLPPSLAEVLEAPVPVLAGQIAPAPRPATSSIVQLFLDSNCLVMHEHEMRALHELKLPRSEALQYELAADAATCFGQAITPQSLERNQVEACEHMSEAIHRHVEGLLEEHLVSAQAAPFFKRFHATQMYSVAAFEAAPSPEDEFAGNKSGCGSDLEGETTTYEVGQ
ncbi:Aste57867_759 [Aphanomyces stellatus]|uniref:Aste57867_759 protein n=1 Tax=Aphanomyces stellatus TaxID=120398 RepID=A0A485K4F8_9STRA|nr:hypothetical protein As57867_000758 [Aphanomyces stellatus]VFT77983.1 Aste57867_759 [Aphanomyces stellatus]